MIIGISGKKQSGKDTVALILQYYTIPKNQRTISVYEWLELGSTVYTPEIIGEKYLPNKKFASKLKDISSYLLNVPLKNFEDESFKETLLPSVWDIFTVKYSDRLLTHNVLFSKFQDAYDFFVQCINLGFEAQEPVESLMTYRDFLIKLGTDGAREQVHPNIWVYSTMSEYNPSTSNWIISDMRFKNELNFIKKFNNVIIRIERNDIPTSTSITEIDLDDSYQEFDHVIYNNGSLTDLVDNVYMLITADRNLRPLFHV